MFIAALSYAYFAKALSGSYMKSTITQLERHFDLPSYLVGIIDGSFELGESGICFTWKCRLWILDSWTLMRSLSAAGYMFDAIPTTFPVCPFSFPYVSVGNLLVIVFVSYFGARLHRPKIIAVGCVLMSFGTFLIAMPHFLVGR